MAERWGDKGPSDEAYSRVTRDLAAVTRDFGLFLDGLTESLMSRFACRVRQVTAAEAARLDGDRDFDTVYAGQPDHPGAATLFVGRAREDGAETVTLAFGEAQRASLPHCFCDACDEDSESLIEETQDSMAAAIQGCREFRRPYTPEPGAQLDAGPWMEEGCETVSGGWAQANHQLQGEPFTARWEPWQERRP